MQPMTRMNRTELIELIEATEAEGNDATELRNFLAQFPNEGRSRPPAKQGGGGRTALDEEELNPHPLFPLTYSPPPSRLGG